MKLAVDLHIHSALSPCGDNDMTPNNIVNMSKLCGLDVIAITDHNAADNCKACMEVGEAADIIVIPGMELMTNEEVHMVCLFPDLYAAAQMQTIVRNMMPKIQNKPDIFGEQLILDSKDKIVGKEDLYLLSPASFDIGEGCSLVRELGGVVIPAHINRDSYSILTTLGAVPDEYHFNTLEISKEVSKEEYRYIHPEYDNLKLIQSSDAHYLIHIQERTCLLTCESRTIDAVLKVLS